MKRLNFAKLLLLLPILSLTFCGVQTAEAANTINIGSNTVAAANIGAQQQNVILQSFTVVTGSTAPYTITGVGFTTAGTYAATDLISFQLYYTTTGTFSTTNLLSTLTPPAAAGAKIFPAFTSPALSTSSTYWFWIIANTKKGAVATRTISVNAITTTDITSSPAPSSSTCTAGGVQTITNGTTLGSALAAPSINVYPSTAKNIIYRFNLNLPAITAPNVTGFQFTTTGTYVAGDIAKFQLWYKANDIFASAVQVGTDITTSLGPGVHSFAAFSQALTASFDNYFWITADISAAPTFPHTITVSPVTLADITISLPPTFGSASAEGTHTIVSGVPPVITSFTPVAGPLGTTVTISGTGFDATPANNTVYFGATQATVSAASSTSLDVIVPSGTIYEYITVTNLANNLTASSFKPFEVTYVCGGYFDPKVDYAGINSPRGLSTGDLDGDGKPDVVTANASGTISTYRNISAAPGTITLDTKVDFATNGSPFHVVIGELDGDGKPDLAVSLATYIKIYRNISTPGAISFAPYDSFAISNSGTGLAIGDLNNDGKNELVTASGTNYRVSILENRSSPGYFNFIPNPCIVLSCAVSAKPYGIALADFDSDGWIDIVVDNNTANTLSIFRNKGISGTIAATSFDLKVDFVTGTWPAGFALSTGDIDGDDKIDIAVPNSHPTTGNTISIFRNTCTPGTISFDPKVDFTTGTLPNSIDIGDLNGDGIPDLVTTNQTAATISVFLNTSTIGTINFDPKVDYATGTTPWGVSVGDMDGDARADVTVANYGSNTISSFFNVCAPLAVEYLSFKGHNEGSVNILNWTTATENNNDYFIVERSIDGRLNDETRHENNIEEIGRIKGAGNINPNTNYSFIDKNPYAGINYYRLKQVDYNGKFTYSKAISINNKQINKSTISIYPIPSGKELNYEFYAEENSIVNIYLIDVCGNIIVHEQTKSNRGMNKSQISIETLSDGMYFLKINTDTKQSQIKFIKQ